MKLLIVMLPVVVAASFFLLREQKDPVSETEIRSIAPAGKIERIGHVPEELDEISGWDFISDSTLAAINDSGNEPIIYTVDTLGHILHRTLLDAENVDFEDVTTDGKGNLFIADIGNNKNLRRQLTIYKVAITDLQNPKVTPKQITTFSYADQQEFPPKHEQLNFDAEAMIWKNDSLLVFTKCRTIPFSGKTNCYKIPDRSGNFSVSPAFELRTGVRSWLNDAVTSACFRNGELYLLTQDRMIRYDFSGAIPVRKSALSILPLTQKESIAVDKNGTVFICDERQKVIGGGTVFRIGQRK